MVKIATVSILHTAALAIAVAIVTGCSASDTSNNVDGDNGLPKDRVVRENMQKIQVAAEKFASDHGHNVYPTTIDDTFKSYLPGGTDGQQPSPVGPPNPFTGYNEFPRLGNLADVKSVRYGPRFAMRPGEIDYSALAGGRGYAIVAGAHDGKVLTDSNYPGEILVFTNLPDQ